MSETKKPAKKVYTFRANDGEPDRYQDRLSVRGWDLEAFNANPVILYMHDEGAGGPLGLAPKTLPIGKGRAYVKGDALMVDIEFDQDDEFAKRVEAKVEGGFLNAVSVRYIMLDFKANELGGFDCAEQELLEISIVTIPGNQRALRAKAAAESGGTTRLAFATRFDPNTLDREAFIRDVQKRVRDSLTETALADAARRAVDALIARKEKS